MPQTSHAVTGEYSYYPLFLSSCFLNTYPSLRITPSIDKLRVSVRCRHGFLQSLLEQSFPQYIPCLRRRSVVQFRCDGKLLFTLEPNRNPYWQAITLHQPSDELPRRERLQERLSRLLNARYLQHHVNFMEIAFDFYDTPLQLMYLQRDLNACLFHAYKRTRCGRAGTTTYTGTRSSKRVLTVYKKPRCGECECIRLELRLRKDPIGSAGISFPVRSASFSAFELRDFFDFRAFDMSKLVMRIYNREKQDYRFRTASLRASRYYRDLYLSQIWSLLRNHELRNNEPATLMEKIESLKSDEKLRPFLRDTGAFLVKAPRGYGTVDVLMLVLRSMVL